MWVYGVRVTGPWVGYGAPSGSDISYPLILGSLSLRRFDDWFL